MNKARFNWRFLEQTSFSSKAPSGLACVLHALKEDGEYSIHVRGEHPDDVHHVRLTVSGAVPPTVRAQDHAVVDRSELHARRLKLGPTAPTQHIVAKSGAHLYIHSPHRHGPYTVDVTRQKDNQQVFDSSTLHENDTFAVTLIRPGEYELINEVNGATTPLQVEYPQIGKVPYRPPAPVEIYCGESGFTSTASTIKPAQGVIFRIKTTARLRLELRKPDDGPPPQIDPEMQKRREAARELLRRFTYRRGQ
jgi:hypothetical protein